jgi:primase-polymerase (primpol)-like protein
MIESKKLPFEENLWLKGLTKDLNARAARSILEESRKKGPGAELETYLHALINANRKAIQEVQTMAKDELPFDKWIEETGLAAKWRAEGKETAWKEAIDLIKQGHTVEELERMSPLAAPSSK